MTRPPTREDETRAFRKATQGMSGAVDRWAARAATGLTDDQLADALRFELGIFGGSCGPGEMDLVFQASGLKIWAGWDIVNHVTDKPLFAGAATIAAARDIYSIRNPEDRQLALL